MEIISDPKSFEYLKWENKQLIVQFKDTKAELSKAQEALHDTIQKYNALIGKAKNIVSTAQNLKKDNDDLETKIHEQKDTIETLENMSWKDFLLFKWRQRAKRKLDAPTP